MTRARDVADTQDNLGGAVPPFVAGKSKIINGDFRISQRGTTFTIGASGYVMDRFFYGVLGAVPTGTISQQTFTPGTAPVAGYEGSNFARINQTADNGSTQINFRQSIEDVRTFAGQTVTFSFWAKADAACDLTSVLATQNFGTGGSSSVNTTVTLNSVALTTAWTRYTGTVSIPSISGLTIGTSSFLQIRVNLPTSGGLSRNGTYDFWGWQLEAGSTATPFQTATGTLQGELALCQRYYYLHASGTTLPIGLATSYSTTLSIAWVSLPVTMRTTPTIVSTTGSNYYVIDIASAGPATNALTIGAASTTSVRLDGSYTGLVLGQAGYLRTNNASSSLAFTSEL
jgi:hypothetical protein